MGLQDELKLSNCSTYRFIGPSGHKHPRQNTSPQHTKKSLFLPHLLSIHTLKILDKIPDHSTQNKPIFTAFVEHTHINHKINTSKYIVKLE